MSLNQKYTWKDFLNAHPELKKKGVKRTSSEGEKAFKAAFKEHSKTYLSERENLIDVLIKRATEKRDALTKKVGDYQKKKDWPSAKIYQTQVGRQDAAIARFQKERTKAEQKRKEL